MFPARLQRLIGPRVPEDEALRSRWKYAAPTILFILAACILAASWFQPYWRMTLLAPQYPGGLTVHAYMDRLEGDVDEIDNLNHYIGMRPLGEAAQLERRTSHLLIGCMALLITAAIFIHTKWAVLPVLPALLFPAGFLADLFYWMHNFGQNLDPTAALSSSVKPFTPPVWGEGKVGNFRTIAEVDTGWWMAVAASVLILIGLVLHRHAFKPLVDHMIRGSIEHTTGRTRSALALLIAGHLLPGDAVTGAQPNESTAPFDLVGAIARATPETVVVVPAGVYEAPLLIDRPLRLVANGRAIIDGRGDGHVVVITAPDVTFRGFEVRGSGASLDREHTGILVTAPRAVIENNTVVDCLFGISLKESPDSVMRGNTIIGKDIHIARRGDGIKLWASHRSLVSENRIDAVRDAVLWYSDNVRISGNHITESRYGLHFMYSHDNVLEDNRLERNSVGVFLMYSRNAKLRRNMMIANRGPSGYGLGVKDMQGMIVEDNLLAGNRIGIYLDNPPIYLPEHDRFTRNIFASNDIGIMLLPSVQRVAIFGNTFSENIQQIALSGGGELRGNLFTVDGKGNHWSDYRGVDLDGDGIGDLPYRAESLWDSMVDREPNLRLFLFSPAQQAIELAAQAFPVVRPRPLLTDDAPLMRPPQSNAPAHAQADPARTWLVAALLLLTGGGLLTLARPHTARCRAQERKR